jgi:hypothetical protein
MDAAPHNLTTAGKVVFSAVPLLLAGVYLYLLWCLVRGRISVRGMSGSRTRWVERRASPKEFWLHWWWSFGGLTLMAVVLLAGLARIYSTIISG